MSSHHSIAGRFFALAAVVTTFDAVKGEEIAEERWLAHKQLAFADRVALTKADMLRDDPAGRREALAALVARINPSARILDIQDPLEQPETLLDHGIYAPDGRSTDVLTWLEAESPLAKAFGVQAASQWFPGIRHSDVYTKSLVIDGSTPP